jgi:hypothetical protein
MIDALAAVVICLAYWWATEGRRERERDLRRREMREERPRR